MIVGLAAAALAGPLDGLHAAAARAERVVSACEAGDCHVTRTQLAEAFVVCAAAAAVFRGELDTTAVANAQHLHPGVIDRWVAILPAADGAVPDPWVLDLGRPPPLLPEPAPEPEPPSRLTRSALALAPGATAVTTLGSLRAGDEGAGWSLDLDARVPTDSAIALWIRGGGGTRARDDVVRPDLHARVGLGPRWVGEGGAELGLLMIGGIETGRLAVGIGAFGVHPLWPRAPLALRWLGAREVPVRGHAEATLCVGSRVQLQAGGLIEQGPTELLSGPMLGIGVR